MPFLLRIDHRALNAILNSTLDSSSRVVNSINQLREFPFSVELLVTPEFLVSRPLAECVFSPSITEGKVPFLFGGMEVDPKILCPSL